MLKLAAVGLGVLVINLPFGYWRAGLRRLSPLWFVAIHVPVPLVVALRLWADIGWSFGTFPVLIGGFFLGQFLGGCLRAHRSVAGTTRRG